MDQGLERTYGFSPEYPDGPRYAHSGLPSGFPLQNNRIDWDSTCVSAEGKNNTPYPQ